LILFREMLLTSLPHPTVEVIKRIYEFVLDAQQPHQLTYLNAFCILCLLDDVNVRSAASLPSTLSSSSYSTYSSYFKSAAATSRSLMQTLLEKFPDIFFTCFPTTLQLQNYLKFCLRSSLLPLRMLGFNFIYSILGTFSRTAILKTMEMTISGSVRTTKC